MRRVCVFCGSSEGARPAYAEAARRLGAELVARKLGLVYGGCAVGLMGVLADAVLGHGGEVIGVIPEPLVTRELAHTGLTELRVVGSMHERKATMASLVDGFIALPGGPRHPRRDIRDLDVGAARYSRQARGRAERRRLLGRAPSAARPRR